MRKNSHLAPTQLADKVSAVLKTHSQAGAFFLLALSGGVDSIVLLHVLAALKEKLNFKLHALHVHHGLSAFADDWARHCQQVCDSLAVPLTVVHVKIDRATKVGIEAEARTKRYQALFAYRDENNRQPDFILTAHHEQDQAETLLLQLSRGAGVKGLAGMAIVDEKKRLLRPLLTIQKSEILDYANAHALNWCEDDSNENITFERNFLRHEILPVWAARHPAIDQNITRTASHLAEASALLDDLAKIDSDTLVDKNSLCLIGLKKLAPMRVKNLMRWWLGCFGLAMPNTDYLNEMISQLFSARNDAMVDFTLGQYALRRFQHRVYMCHVSSQKAEPIVWQGEDQIALPHGILYFKRAKGVGLLRINAQATLRISYRSGGELIKATDHRPARTLKYLMQENHIPPWERKIWPLIYLNHQLACVPNIGVAHDLQTVENEAGLLVFYQHTSPSMVG